MDKMTNSNACTKQIGQVLRTADSLLHDSILGIYLHGSATLNRLRPDSDIDILIITAKDLSDWEREHLTRQLLDISGPVGCPGKGPWKSQSSLSMTSAHGAFRHDATTCTENGFGKKWKPVTVLRHAMTRT